MNLCASYGSVCISNIEQNSECSVLFAVFQIFINQRNSYIFLMVFGSQAGLVFSFYRQQRKTEYSGFIQDAGLKLKLWLSMANLQSISTLISQIFRPASVIFLYATLYFVYFVVYFLSPTSTAACIFSNKPFLHLVLLMYSLVIIISSADDPIMI